MDTPGCSFVLILTTVGSAEDARLLELHPYELPAIYSLRPEQALPAFASWVQQP